MTYMTFFMGILQNVVAMFNSVQIWGLFSPWQFIVGTSFIAIAVKVVMRLFSGGAAERVAGNINSGKSLGNSKQINSISNHEFFNKKL